MAAQAGSQVVADAAGHAFVSDPAGNQVVVIDLATLASQTIPVGSQPQGLALSPDGTKLYVADTGSSFVSVVDVAQRREDHRIPVPPGAGSNDTPYSIAVASNGKAFVATTFNGSGFGARMVEINLATEATTVRTDFYLGRTTEQTKLAASGDHSRIGIVAGDISSGPLFIYKAATDTFTSEYDTNSLVSNVALDRTGAHVVVVPGTYVFDGTPALQATIPGGGLGVAVTPAGDAAFRVQATSIELLDLTRGLVTGRIDLPQSAGTATGGIALGSDGSTVVVLTTTEVLVLKVVPKVTITDHPADPTLATSATFSFGASDADEPGAPLSLACSLDGAAPAKCDSPAAYQNLGAGAHTFTVQATDPGGEIGSASFAWTVNAPGAPPPPAPPTPVPPTPAPRNGYWMLRSDGAVYSFGDAPGGGAGPVLPFGLTAAGIAPSPSGLGYWVADTFGGVYSFRAPLFPGRPALHAGEKITSISATASGAGYWLFSSEGRVFTYGDAQYFGDMGGTRLNGPVLGSVPTPSGRGYYMVASDGGIFAFGDATFAGSMGGQPLNKPVVGLAPNPSGTGYWLVASDGGIFAFGSPFKGSMGGSPLNKPVIGTVAYGDGYLMVASDGGIFDFSSKPFLGSLGSLRMSSPIVGVAPLPG
jgi:YVTN family beta-propeller protein